MECNFFLKCECCQIGYDALKRKPIALRCGHSFCFSCIEKAFKARSYLNCWACNKKHFHELGNLPVNQIIYTYLLNQNIKSESGKILFIKGSSKFSFYHNIMVKCQHFSFISIKNKLEMSNNINNYCSKYIIDSHNHKNNAVIFFYFDILKILLCETDNLVQKFANKYNTLEYFQGSKFTFGYLIIVLKLLLITLSIMISIYLVKLQFFYQFYLFSTLTFETINCIRKPFSCCINICLNRWISFIIFVFTIFLVELTNLSSTLLFDNLWSCLKTIFVLIIVGSDKELNLIISNMYLL